MKQWREDLWKKIQDRVIAHFEGESGIVVIEQTDNRRAEITNIEFHDWAVEVDYKDPDNFTINSTFYVGVQPDTKWEHHFIDVGVRLGRNPLGNFAPFIKRLNMGNDLRNYIVNGKPFVTNKSFEELTTEKVDEFLEELATVKMKRPETD